MATIKLRTKQLQQISNLQAKKQQLQQLTQEVNQAETAFLELIFEEHSVEGELTSVKLEQDTLVYELAPIKVKKGKKPENSTEEK